MDMLLVNYRGMYELAKQNLQNHLTFIEYDLFNHSVGEPDLERMIVAAKTLDQYATAYKDYMDSCNITKKFFGLYNDIYYSEYFIGKHYWEIIKPKIYTDEDELL